MSEILLYLEESVDLDQIPHSVASDLDLHSKQRTICPNTGKKIRCLKI